MDPLDPASFNLRTISLKSGRKYEYCDQVPARYVHGETDILVLLHGFPETWYDWRYQIGPWTRAGWRVMVPSMLGYGETDKPDDPAAYAQLSLAGDIAALLDALDIKFPVVVIGHDWGSAVTWAFGTRYRERIKALVAMSTPYLPPMAQRINAQQLVESQPGLFGYWSLLSAPNAADLIRPNVGRLLDCMYRKSETLDHNLWAVSAEDYILGRKPLPGPSDLMSDAERRYHIEALEKTGLKGPLNYYHALEHRYDSERALNLDPKLPSTLPVLFIAPDDEPFCSPSRLERTTKYVPSMEVVRMPNTAHFVLLERKTEVTKLVASWLQTKIGSPSSALSRL